MLRLRPGPGHYVGNGGFSPARVHTFSLAIVIEQMRVRIAEVSKERTALATVVDETIAKYKLDPKKALKRLDRMVNRHDYDTIVPELRDLVRARVLWSSLDVMIKDYENVLEAATHKDCMGSTMLGIEKADTREIFDLSTDEVSLVFRPFDAAKWRETMLADEPEPMAAVGVGTALGRVYPAAMPMRGHYEVAGPVDVVGALGDPADG